MLFTLAGMLSFSAAEQPKNAPSPTEATPSGMTIYPRLAQYSNALEPMLFTLAGISMPVMRAQ